MFCGKLEYNLMEKTHKRALKVLNLDYTSNYSQLLEKSSCVTLHVKHLQHLMTEIYKTFKHLNPVFMKEIFITKEGCYNFRNVNLLKVHTPRTERFGVREISFRGSQIWNQLPNHYKQSESLNIFKNKIKQNGVGMSVIAIYAYNSFSNIFILYIFDFMLVFISILKLPLLLAVQLTLKLNTNTKNTIISFI